MRVNANLKPDDDSFEIGKKAEDLFVEVCGKKGYEAIKSSKQQDMYDHIDYHVKNKAGDMKSFDVKSRKRTSRRDSEFNDDWQWIEFLNVNGKAGWIKGKADFIAFELKGAFLIARRSELRELCKKLITDTKTRVSEGRLAKYKLYSRNGRKDVLTQIKTQDIRDGLKTWEWCK